MAPVPGHPGYYVTTCGRVYNETLNRYSLPAFDEPKNCRVAVFYIQGMRKRYRLHRLIAEAFLEKEEGFDNVGFKDGDARNCRLDNLVWQILRTNKKTVEERILENQVFKKHIPNAILSDRKRASDNKAHNQALGTMGLLRMYRFNSGLVKGLIIDHYKKYGYVPDELCETILMTTPAVEDQLKALILYFPMALRQIRYIYDADVIELMEKYNTTIQIMKSHIKSTKSSVRSNMYDAAKTRAKAKDLPFNICAEDILLPIHCSYLGVELTYGRNKTSKTSPSLDKIIPHLGYVKGNIQVISVLANSMKSNATPEEIRMFSNRALTMH